MSKNGGNLILLIEQSGHKEFVLAAQFLYDIVCTYCTYVYAVSKENIPGSNGQNRFCYVNLVYSLLKRGIGASVFDNIFIAIFSNIIPTIF